VLQREEGEGHYEITVRLDAWQVERLKSEGYDLEPAAPRREERRRTG